MQLPFFLKEIFVGSHHGPVFSANAESEALRDRCEQSRFQYTSRAKDDEVKKEVRIINHLSLPEI